MPLVKIAFPKESVDNNTWVAMDFNPPYDGQWPHGIVPKLFLEYV